MSTPHPYFSDDMTTVHLGDCLDVLAGMEAGSVDAVVTDPPYDLTAGKKGGSGEKSLNVPSPAGRSRVTTGGFMGKDWDSTGIAFRPETWQAVLRVLKPGGYLLAFGGTRTWHRLACAIEDAGFEIRDSVADLTGIDGPGLLWLQGSGFPKSLDVSKAIDKAAGAEREVTGAGRWAGRESPADLGVMNDDSWQGGSVRVETAPATDDAARWEGWGTALKPAHEPIVVARKPLAGTVAANVLEHGTGALNIDGCRVGGETVSTHSRGRNTAFPKRPGETTVEESGRARRQDLIDPSPREGRWPPNVLLGEEAAAELDRQSGKDGAFAPVRGAEPSAVAKDAYGQRRRVPGAFHGDEGGASRFFPVFRYEAKAGSAERPRLADGTAHVTVKPVDLIRWLVRLVTPPGGLVLDCFAGSGTTGEACIIEGFQSVLIERDPKYAELIMARLRKPVQPDLFGGAA